MRKFTGHPGHLANSVDLGHRAGHHDPRHPLCLQVGHQHHRAGLQHHQAGRHLQHFQLSVQAAGPGEGDEQGRHCYICPKYIPIQSSSISKHFISTVKPLNALDLNLI